MGFEDCSFDWLQPLCSVGAALRFLLDSTHGPTADEWFYTSVVQTLKATPVNEAVKLLVSLREVVFLFYFSDLLSAAP